MLEGWGGTHLLDTYSTERQPIGLRNTMEAADCFNRLSNVMKYGDELDLDTIEGERIRNGLAVDLKDQEKLISSSGTLLGYRYANSPIIIADGSPEPADDPRTYIPVARPGHRAPHIWIQEGVSILDLMGSNFTLLCFNDKAQGISNFLDCSKQMGIPLTILPIHDRDAAELYGNDFVLIRPDLMVAWRTDEIPENPEQILNIIRGAF